MSEPVDSAATDPRDAPSLLEAVRRMDAMYEQLEATIAEEDVDALSDLVAERGRTIEKFRAACEAEALEPETRDRLAERERGVQSKMRDLHDRMRDRLRDGSQRARAVRGYARH